VIEVNEFKHLIHFSLKIFAANQELIKSSISQTFRNLKLENEKLENRLHSIELQLSENVLLKAKELEIIENECQLKLKNTEIKLKKEIDLQKHLINELMAKESESKSLIEKLRTQLETSEQNVRQQQKLRTENELQTITELNNKIVSLEQQLCETQDFYNIEKRERIRAETELEEKEKILHQSNQNNELLTQDLSKANQIIRKLQTEVQSTHQKLSLLNKVSLSDFDLNFL
jgi:spindle assembly abnormal protein 6